MCVAKKVSESLTVCTLLGKGEKEDFIDLLKYNGK